MGPTLTDLPNELLLLIADCLGYGDLTRLQRCSRELHDVLTAYYHRRVVQEGASASLLCWAAFENRVPLVQALVAQGASVSAAKSAGEGAERYFKGYTPLHVAAACGNAAVARVLLSLGAPVDARVVPPYMDLKGETPLHLGVAGVSDDRDRPTRGHVTVVALLLKHGANPNARNDWDITPLYNLVHTVNSRRAVIMTRLLCAAGADPNAWKREPAGANRDLHSSLLHTLSMAGKGCVEAVEVLLQAGADPNTVDNNRMTPLQNIIQYRSETTYERIDIEWHRKFALVLLRYGATLENLSKEWYWMEDARERLQTLLEEQEYE